MRWRTDHLSWGIEKPQWWPWCGCWSQQSRWQESTGGEGSRVPKSLMNEEELQEAQKIPGGVGLTSLTVSVWMIFQNLEGISIWRVKGECESPTALGCVKVPLRAKPACGSQGEESLRINLPTYGPGDQQCLILCVCACKGTPADDRTQVMKPNSSLDSESPLKYPSPRTSASKQWWDIRWDGDSQSRRDLPPLAAYSWALEGLRVWAQILVFICKASLCLQHLCMVPSGICVSPHS